MQPQYVKLRWLRLKADEEEKSRYFGQVISPCPFRKFGLNYLKKKLCR